MGVFVCSVEFIVVMTAPTSGRGKRRATGLLVGLIIAGLLVPVPASGKKFSARGSSKGHSTQDSAPAHRAGEHHRAGDDTARRAAEDEAVREQGTTIVVPRVGTSEQSPGGGQPQHQSQPGGAQAAGANPPRGLPADDYYARRAKSVLSENGEAGADAAYANAGQQGGWAVLCVGGCYGDAARTVYVEQRPASETVQTSVAAVATADAQNGAASGSPGILKPSAATVEGATARATLPGTEDILCLGGCYDDTPRRYRGVTGKIPADASVRAGAKLQQGTESAWRTLVQSGNGASQR